jgi:L-amino acid N-acyltransferase YncA
MGYGPAMLKALEPLAKEAGFVTLFAEVAYENIRSQQCFIKAAWMPVLFEVHL